MKISEYMQELRLKLIYRSRLDKSIHHVKLTVTYLFRYGPVYTAGKICKHFLRPAPRRQSGSEWIKKHEYTPQRLDLQRKETFEREILFSIITPLYNTPDTYLRDMLDSVLAQTYPHWELCLADASTDGHESVGQICREYALADSRIHYRKLADNLGIAANTNEALTMASGEYVAFLDHDDILSPAALYEMAALLRNKDADLIYTDEATFLSPDRGRITFVHCKPDFAIDNLRANNYICHFTAYRRSLLDVVGKYRSEYDGSQDHDMMLRIAAVTDRIEHIPEVLYFWRAFPESTAYKADAKPAAAAAGRKAVSDNLRSAGLQAEVKSRKEAATIYNIQYALTGTPKVSIIIQSCDRIYYLKRCLESIAAKTTYKNYEIIIVENNSKKSETFAYYKEAERKWQNVRVLYWEKAWNWSALNNYAVREAAAGDYYLLLNNDTAVISPDWIEQLLMFAQRGDVGAVGAMLYYPDNTIQHAGVIIGMGGVASHAFRNVERGMSGYAGRLLYAQDLSAVTGACMMIPRGVWDDVCGLDEAFAVEWNDIDLCLRIRKAGYLVVWTPHAELYHYESQSRGRNNTPKKYARSQKSRERFLTRWKEYYVKGDPYYSPHLSLRHPDFRFKDDREAADILNEVGNGTTEQSGKE
ncbi:MAG: glycosyltransferase family 2 protein [Eubacteriales bacterium]|nr:glycosyltransferase family 2 protein [Eubacteriales bacterium]